MRQIDGSIIKPTLLILDLDGVLTDGKFHYSSEGKVYKIFGADDHDAINLLKKYIKIIVVTADSQGLAISQRRVVKDMQLELHLVNSVNRIDWILKEYPNQDIIYMGDGIFDPIVFKKVGFSIAPRNASKLTQSEANFVTESSGGERAVAEACIFILNEFFNIKLGDLLSSPKDYPL
jgi:3-deoxy-D-manno-octulosonate 8-phosphate phosphatase (KDO 8-P phosphatase)